MEQLVADIHTVATPDYINQLQKRLERVKQRIDDTNRRREVLSAQVETISAVMDYLNKTRQNGNNIPELPLLESFLAERQILLRKRLAELKPSDLLQEKHDLTVEISAVLMSRSVASSLANMLRETAAGDKTHAG